MWTAPGNSRPRGRLSISLLCLNGKKTEAATLQLEITPHSSWGPKATSTGWASACSHFAPSRQFELFCKPPSQPTCFIAQIQHHACSPTVIYLFRSATGSCPCVQAARHVGSSSHADDQSHGKQQVLVFVVVFHGTPGC